MIFAKMFATLGLVVIAVFGGVIGNWISHRTYPIVTFERLVMTPQVKPGEMFKIKLKIERREQCNIVVQRTITYSDGSREPIRVEFGPGFGPLGADTYVSNTPIQEHAPPGGAVMRSQGFSHCNPIERLFNVASDVSIDTFEVLAE
jgi:hypothetical protein